MAARPLLIECERCGQQQCVERAGRFRDKDYTELQHEYFWLEFLLVNALIELVRQLPSHKWDSDDEIEATARQLRWELLDEREVVAS